jgi:hypothetical protein
MFETFQTAIAILVAFTLAQLAPMTAEAQNLADRDAKEVADYVLTEAAFAKYSLAAHKLQPLMEQVPKNCDAESPQSLNGTAARMDGVPAVKSALKTAGMTSREYMVFS